MAFEDIIAVLERTFQTELAVVQGTTAFEVSGEDGATKVRVLVQDEDERGLVLLSAELGEPPPEGRERLFRTMLEANNLFAGTAGATLALDAASGECRLQAFLAPAELANDVEGRLVPFLETALEWRRAIEDFRASGGGEAEPGGGFGMLPV